MNLSPAHWHLLLNHFPTIGFIIGLGLFIIALIAKSDHLKVGGLVVFVAMALLTIPTYVTGNAAEEAICRAAESTAPCQDAAISRALIEMHEGAAFLSLVLMGITGAVSWLGVWLYRRRGRVPGWNVVAVLALAAVTLGMVARAASLGGQIHHPEIRVAQAAAGTPLARVVGDFVRNTPWTWVACETVHFIGLSLLIGVVVLIDLKTLGFAPALSSRAVDRLLPWAILGFGLNLVTGMLFFVAAPEQYTRNPAFYWKISFVLAAGVNTLIFTFDDGWAIEGKAAPVRTKALAVTAFAFWVGVMYWGSMLPFIGNAF